MRRSLKRPLRRIISRPEIIQRVIVELLEYKYRIACIMTASQVWCSGASFDASGHSATKVER